MTGLGFFLFAQDFQQQFSILKTLQSPFKMAISIHRLARHHLDPAAQITGAQIHDQDDLLDNEAAAAIATANHAGSLQQNVFAPNDLQLSGHRNFTVSGAAFSGPGITLLPNSSITVSVKEEFQRTETVTPGTMTFGGLRPSPENGRRPNYLQVTLVSAEEFGPAPAASLRPPSGPEDDSLVIENVKPGHYRVRVNTSIGFVSSITSGGTDLQRQPLVVGGDGSQQQEADQAPLPARCGRLRPPSSHRQSVRGGW